MTEYTISIFSENKVGILSRVVSVFTRRYINIESINSSKSSIKDIYRYTIVVNTTEVMIKKLCAQLEKQIDILKAFYYEKNEIVYQEIALYKVPTHIFNNGDTVEQLVRSHNARIISIEPDYIVIEKTGHKEETDILLAALQEIGIYEFVRSGRVAISKPMEQLNRYLESIQLENAN